MDIGLLQLTKRIARMDMGLLESTEGNMDLGLPK
jgi:hypothetical protein